MAGGNDGKDESQERASAWRDTGIRHALLAFPVFVLSAFVGLAIGDLLPIGFHEGTACIFFMGFLGSFLCSVFGVRRGYRVSNRREFSAMESGLHGVAFLVMCLSALGMVFFGFVLIPAFIRGIW